jgi:serine/threonine protein kinase
MQPGEACRVGLCVLEVLEVGSTAHCTSLIHMTQLIVVRMQCCTLLCIENSVEVRIACVILPVQITHGMSCPLQAMHEVGYVHRDIKV